MTIQDAIKSGKKFFRKSGDSICHPGPGFYYLTKEDILATDWEVETVKKELSAEDIKSAFWDAMHNYTSLDNRLKSIIKKLGLE